MKEKNTKSKIVEAAWQLFYEKGYERTTVEEIIAKSGTSKGSFYHYFSSKDSLMGSLAYLLMSDMMSWRRKSYRTAIGLTHFSF